MFSVRLHAFLFLLLAAGLCGCSRGAIVNGKVTVDGKEVNGGTLILSPLPVEGNAFPGKPGTANVESDGTYSMELESGASGLPYRFTVRFTPPPVKMNRATSQDVVLPYVGLVPKEGEVEVKPGPNVINVELIPGPQK